MRCFECGGEVIETIGSVRRYSFEPMPPMWRAVYSREMGRKNRRNDAKGRHVSPQGDSFGSCNCVFLNRLPS